MADAERLLSFLLKPVRRACKEFALIAPGDWVAVGVSGGKDSRALLELLIRHRRTAPYQYSILALHIDATSAGLPDARPTLEPWLRDLGISYAIAPLELPAGEPLPLDCHRCSWNRRKALFRATVGHECSKLAIAHHADDASETALMNLLFNGRLETMAPKVPFFDGAVTLIRPLVYAQERRIAYYARVAGYPELPPCPQSAASRRTQIKRILRQFGPQEKVVRANLWRATRREMGF